MHTAAAKIHDQGGQVGKQGAPAQKQQQGRSQKQKVAPVFPKLCVWGFALFALRPLHVGCLKSHQQQEQVKRKVEPYDPAPADDLEHCTQDERGACPGKPTDPPRHTVLYLGIVPGGKIDPGVERAQKGKVQKAHRHHSQQGEGKGVGGPEQSKTPQRGDSAAGQNDFPGRKHMVGQHAGAHKGNEICHCRSGGKKAEERFAQPMFRKVQGVK